MDTVADLRKEYRQAHLGVADVAANPIAQFRAWLDEALAADVPEPTGMTLATVSEDGQPSARVVLLKGVDEAGFVFYTNYESRKGRELEAQPRAALTFWWQALERQVRIEGRVERVSPETSDGYFESRPRGSRLGAWASPQSQPIEERAVLEERLKALQKKYGDEEAVPRPPHWGGYRVVPAAVEFWQGRPSRLHDRLRYRRSESENEWTLERLAP